MTLEVLCGEVHVMLDVCGNSVIRVFSWKTDVKKLYKLHQVIKNDHQKLNPQAQLLIKGNHS